MIETIYENNKEKQRTKEEKNYIARVPNNRRQIGQPGQGELEVFIEDYAFSFAKRLSERDYTGCIVGVLVGEYAGAGEKILVRGILEARDVLVQDMVCFTEENWAGIYRDIRDYFPGQQIVGWYLGGPGFLLEDEERQKKIQTDNFGGGDKVLLKMDSIEKEQYLLYYKEGRMKELPGYYIYYEKNTEMQNYMVETKQPVTTELVQLTAEREEKSEEEKVVYSLSKPVSQPQENENFYRLFYVTSAVLACLACLVIAGLAMQIKERNTLQAMLNNQVRQVGSVQQVYVAEAGETIESICVKFYGNAELSSELRMLNGLSAGEEPVPGQKLFLP